MPDYRHVYIYEDDNRRGIAKFLASNTKNLWMMLGTLVLLALGAVWFNAGIILGLFHSEKDARFTGRLPNSLLTLNYPLTLLRGVVMEQPVHESDVPVIWHPHKPDSRVVQKTLTNCYGIELIELDSLEAIQRAKEVKLASRSANKFAITSPYLREVAEIFTPQHLGRATCFFRHPLDYDLYEKLPIYESDDNWMVRFLLNDGKTRFGFKELGMAKQIVREVCVVCTMDKLVESIKRAAAYYGWTLESTEQCVEEAVAEESTQERVLDHESAEWKKFYSRHQYDCEIYEFVQQTWRAQIQTIIPFSLQKKRHKHDSEEQEEK
jgi:hypothetical protein